MPSGAEAGGSGARFGEICGGFHSVLLDFFFRPSPQVSPRRDLLPFSLFFFAGVSCVIEHDIFRNPSDSRRSHRIL